MRLPLVAPFLPVALLLGCDAKNPGKWEGPLANPSISSQPWAYYGTPGQLLASPNYRFYTTVANPQSTRNLVLLLEGGLNEYRKVVPTAPPTSQLGGPMDCYVFANRPQWSDFTRRNTGAMSNLYLQITRGGYTIGDWFVAYQTAERDTWSVTAHEGFHQFCARHMKARFPPFLEEGFATSFEKVRWQDGLPRFNPSVNPDKAQSLRTALDFKATIPLDRLVTLHAGLLLSGTGQQTQTFYAEGWAFGRMMREHPRYAPLFSKWAADAQAGTLYAPPGRPPNVWDPTTAQPVVEHYLQTDFPALQKDFDAWCHRLAHDELSAQFAG